METRKVGELEAQKNSSVYYERRYKNWGLRFHREVIAWMMEGIWPDYRVLDAGCGTGIIGRLYPYLAISGIDLSPEMIKLCPTTKLGYGSPPLVNQSYAVGSVTEMDHIGAETHDVVVCRSLLHHLPDHKKALREFRRVLKPGGKLVTWDPNQSWIGENVRHFTQHGDRFSSWHHSFKPVELVKDLQEAGFVVDEVRQMGFLSYPIFGFPDIAPIADYIPFKPVVYRVAQAIDLMLEKVPGLNRMSWAVGIRSHKA